MQTHLRLEVLIPGNPALESPCQLVRVESPDHFLAALVSGLLIPHVVSPHHERPLHILLAVLDLHIPNCHQGLVLSPVDCLSIHPLEPPSIENLL